MRPTELIAAPQVPRSGQHARKLLVTQKLPPRNLYETIGILTQESDYSFHFSYLSAYVQAEYFRELPGLPKDPGGVDSDLLFPFFAERVISPARPDRSKSLAFLRLSESAEPFEILARSGGSRINDHLELLPFPEAVGEDRYTFTFFVHGVRYLDGEGHCVLEQLGPGEALQVEREPSNPESELALKISHNGASLGYIPHPLLNFVNPAVAAGDYNLTVVQRNSPDAGFHQRLLVRLDYTARGCDAPFSGVDLTEF